MSDDNSKLDLTRRKVLGGLGGVGAGAALGGTGTMAFLNDTEKIADNTVTAGELDLKLDWKTFYYGKKLYTDHQPPANNPGPMFNINDAKPGDVGGGCVSLHVHDNPAYIWAACDMHKNAENGVNEPESNSEYEDDDYGENSGDNRSGELADKVQVALLRFPLTYDGNDIESEANAVKAAVRDDGNLSQSEFGEIQSGCEGIFYNTTLKEFCKGPLHNGHLLDGGDAVDVSASGGSRKGKCFQPSQTYWYCFLWWIPTHVGNSIQSDGVKFDLKFGAQQCRHNDDPENPFGKKKITTETGDGFAKVARNFNDDGTSSAGARARYGNNALSGAWELGVGDEPGAAGEFAQENYEWTSGQTVDWSAEYDESNDELSFTFDGNTISDTIDNPQPDGRMAIQGKADEATVEASIDSLSVDGSSVPLDGPDEVTASNDGSGRQVRHLLVNTDLDGSTDFELAGEATVTIQGDYPGGDEDVAFDVVFE